MSFIYFLLLALAAVGQKALLLPSVCVSAALWWRRQTGWQQLSLGQNGESAQGRGDPRIIQPFADTQMAAPIPPPAPFD